DLGDAHGTVAVRMPRHDVALELLRETGPLAVSSANRTGRPAARTAIEAEAELGEFVAFTLDAGSTAAGALASTIIDATALRDGGRLRVLRDGAIPRGDIEALVGADRFEVAVP
ncbi:MAG TPA: Sua5/YciO/YrdC/YwlC family protein, partial [Microbacteriaceae bacterium]|nr:Sua5/YciO/YrdC/YwlC family protein [Microbacteriaceae bacterium]